MVPVEFHLWGVERASSLNPVYPEISILFLRLTLNPSIPFFTVLLSTPPYRHAAGRSSVLRVVKSELYCEASSLESALFSLAVIAFVAELLPPRLYFYAARWKFWHVPWHLFLSPSKWSRGEQSTADVPTGRACWRIFWITCRPDEECVKISQANIEGWKFSLTELTRWNNFSSGTNCCSGTYQTGCVKMGELFRRQT